MKDFNSWNFKKKKINSSSIIRLFHEREIWWASFGVNIGREQNGTGVNFERPIVILKKLSSDTFICLPLTTKKKLPKFQSIVTHEKVKGFIMLDQIRVFDTKRLVRKIGKLSVSEFNIMKKRLKEIL